MFIPITRVTEHEVSSELFPNGEKRRKSSSQRTCATFNYDDGIRR